MLKTIAEWNPVSSMAEALRELFGNPRGDFGANPPWPIVHPVAYTVIWIIGLVVVCAPLAVWAYRRTVSD